MVINTNISSLTAQEASKNTNNSISSSLEKLSTGLKINKASDDASGLAIADKLRTQVTSINQGVANGNSAVSLLQIADKSMAEQSTILDTIKAKLIQASTDTTSAEGREAIKNDVQKLLTQLDNIAEQTNYNGMDLLNGNSFSFQVGEGATDTIVAKPSSAANTSSLGSAANNLTATLVHTTGANASTAQVDTITFADGGGTWAAGDTASVQIKSATSDETYTYSYTVTEADITADGTTAVENAVGTAMIALINVDTASHGITAGGTSPAVTLTAGTNDVRYENTSSVGKSLSGLTSANLANDTLTSAVAKDYQTVVDGAIDGLNSLRSEFGSTQNQVESAVRNLMTQSTNLSAAESIIRDVDYAEESANFNKQNIISQAGSYAISQANTVQQNVLKLLQ
jgi:flagellin